MADELFYCGKTINQRGYGILQRHMCDLLKSTKDKKLFDEKLKSFKIDKNIFRYLINKNILYINLNPNYLELIIKNINVNDLYDFLFIQNENKIKARFNLQDTGEILSNYDFDIHLYSELASKLNLDYVKIGLENFNGIINEEGFIINIYSDFSLGTYLFNNNKDMSYDYFKILKLYENKNGSFLFEPETPEIRNKIKLYYDFLDMYNK